MTARKVNQGMWLLLIVLVFGVVATAFFGNKVMHKRSDSLVQVKLESRSLDEQRTALAEAIKSVEKYSELNEIAKAIVPQDKDQAKSVRELVKIAAESGIRISTINFPASNLGANNNSESQVKKVEGISGVYNLEITIQSDPSTPVTFTSLTEFLSRLEKNRRTAQVTNIAVQPNQQNRNLLSFSMILNAYIKP